MSSIITNKQIFQEDSKQQQQQQQCEIYTTACPPVCVHACSPGRFLRLHYRQIHSKVGNIFIQDHTRKTALFLATGVHGAAAHVKGQIQSDSTGIFGNRFARDDRRRATKQFIQLGISKHQQIVF